MELAPTLDQHRRLAAELHEFGATFDVVGSVAAGVGSPGDLDLELGDHPAAVEAMLEALRQVGAVSRSGPWPTEVHLRDAGVWTFATTGGLVDVFVGWGRA